MAHTYHTNLNIHIKDGMAFLWVKKFKILEKDVDSGMHIKINFIGHRTTFLKNKLTSRIHTCWECDIHKLNWSLHVKYAMK